MLIADVPCSRWLITGAGFQMPNLGTGMGAVVESNNWELRWTISAGDLVRGGVS